MNNNWEYDYSELYQNNGQTAQRSTYEPQEQYAVPVKKKGGWVRRVIASVLLVACCFGAGYGGSFLANQNASISSQDGPTLKTPSSSSAANSGTGTSNPAPASATGAMTTTELAAMVQPSVVEVTTESVVTNNFFFGDYVQSGAGSGVILTEDGYIVTNNHVVSGASQVTVRLQDGSEYPATVVGTDSRTDIAVIKIDATGLTPATLGDSDALRVGDYVMAVGNPLGNFGGSVTDGIISGLDRSISVENTVMHVLQTNAAISPGNSGGGLFNARGELVGIVNAKSSDEKAEGLGFAIPVNTAAQIAQELMQNGFVSGRPAMGVIVVSIEDAQTAYQYRVNQLGVYVQSVNEGSAAEAAGLQPGDRFLSIDETVINSSGDISNVLGEHAVGDTVSIQLVRGSRIVTVQLTLEESKPQASSETSQPDEG